MPNLRATSLTAAIALLLTGVLGIEPAAAVPANDDLADAAVFSLTSSGPLHASNVGATAEASEPDHAGMSSTTSVWWRFTAPESGDLTLSTLGSDFDTLLAVYTGGAMASLSEVASNDDGPVDLTSEVELLASAGTTYVVAVAGYGSEVGDIVLAFDWVPSSTPPPTNDDFADAISFDLTATGPVVGSNVTATDESDEPSHQSYEQHPHSVWWQFTAPFRGDVRLSTTGSDFNAVVAVYTGSSLTDLEQVYQATYDQVPAPIAVQPDVTYHVAVTGEDGETGNIELGWTWAEASPQGIIRIEDLTGAPNEGGLDLGTVEVGRVNQRTLYMHNVGNAPLTITGLDIVARSFARGEYRVVDDGTSRGPIPPSSYREFVIEFAPTTAPSGPPDAEPHDELLAGVGRTVVDYHYVGGFLVLLDLYTYFHNAGGAGDVAWTATASYPTGIGVVDEAAGTASLSGGDAYAMVTQATVFGTTITEAHVELTLPDGFAFDHVFDASYPSENPGINSLGGTSFRRLEDALLIIRSDDPETLSSNPAGTLVPLYGETATPGVAPTGGVQRWSGPDRYATAAAVSANTRPNGADTVLISTGSNFPDALAGGPAGSVLDAPILLTGTNTLPAATITELQRLAPTTIIVLGGTAAISDSVVSQLQQHAATVTRWSGPDRYATAAAVSANTRPNGADTVLISTGSNFPDALAGGPAGSVLDAPILLTGTNTLPAATITELQRLAPTTIIVLGGTAAISDSVVSQLQQHAATVTRWSGPDRYATAAAVSANTRPNGADTVLISTGSNFPDALAGGPAGSVLDAPILLTGTNTLPAATITELQRLAPTTIIVLGGTAAISDTVVSQLDGLLR